MMFLQDVNILEELFLSTEIYGLLGVIGIVIIGYFLSEKDKFLGAFWFVLESLLAAYYYELVESTPAYWWNILILLVGGILFCLVPLVSRRN